MKLKEIIELAYHRSNEDIEDVEPRIDKILINAINQGYCFIATTVDKKTKSITLPYAEKITLPLDYHSLIEVKHSTYGILAKTDYLIEGNLLIPKLSEVSTGTFNLTYIFIPDFISDVEASVNIKDMYCVALSAYSAYQYMLSEKQYNSANILLNEFMMILGREGNNNEA